MTSRHWIRASGASKPFNGSVFVWDIEIQVKNESFTMLKRLEVILKKTRPV
jgi:hypothetical protein